MKPFSPEDLDENDLDQLTSEIAGSSPEGWSDDNLRRVIVAGANLLTEQSDGWPKRRFHASITAGADTREQMVADLRSLIEEIDSGANGPAASGSVISGYTFVVEVNEQITNDEYFRLMDERQGRNVAG